jgi:hypothetical protein
MVKVQCVLRTENLGNKHTRVEIGNRFDSLSMWHFKGTSVDESVWHEDSESMPAGWIKEQYPWINEIQLFVVSGGSAVGHPRGAQDAMLCEFDRDMFINPLDRSRMDDYDFSPLIRACSNILRQQVKPVLKLHGIPLKYSKDPLIGWFRVNVRPPDDYEIYASYVESMVRALVDSFGIDEVRSWRWFIGTEMENIDWWLAYDGTGQTTSSEFCKLYDFSVEALERVLGREFVQVGSHAMMNGVDRQGSWDPSDFIKHCRSGQNAANDRTGAKLDFFAISYYDQSAKKPDGVTNVPSESPIHNPVPASLHQLNWIVDQARTLLDSMGFQNLPLEVSEGGLLYGSDGKWLWHGLCPGGGFDATWTVVSLYRMLQTGIVRWSRWPLLRTSGLFGGLELASTHVLRLIHRMENDYLMPVEIVYNKDNEQHVYAVASKSISTNEFHVLICNHSVPCDYEVTKTPDMHAEEQYSASIIVDVKNPDDSSRQVEIIRIGPLLGDFWPVWERDRMGMGLTDSDFFRSKDQADVLHALIDPMHRNWFRKLSQRYIEFAQFPDAVCQSLNSDESITINLCAGEVVLLTFI